MTTIPRSRGTEFVKISKLIMAPMTEVFLWCTDYSSLDSQIVGSGGSQARRIISRDSRKISFVDTYVDTAIKVRKVEVQLHPPNRWKAKFSGGRWHGTGMYVLSEIPEGTRLDIVFRIEKTIEGYTAEELRKLANKTWDRYVSEMEKTLRSSGKR